MTEFYAQWPIEVQTVDGKHEQIRIGLLKSESDLDGQIVIDCDRPGPVVLVFPTDVSTAVRQALLEQGARKLGSG